MRKTKSEWMRYALFAPVRWWRTLRARRFRRKFGLDDLDPMTKHDLEMAHALSRAQLASKFNPCKICGATSVFDHRFHPKYPTDLEKTLRARGYSGAELLRLLLFHADFKREPNYELPSDGLRGKPVRVIKPAEYTDRGASGANDVGSGW